MAEQQSLDKILSIKNIPPDKSSIRLKRGPKAGVTAATYIEIPDEESDIVNEINSPEYES